MLEKLTSTDRTGDFVHESQAMAAPQGFKNVSKLWYDRTISIDQGREAMATDRQNRVDIVATFTEMAPTVSDSGQFVWRHADGREFIPTPHALEQSAVKCGVSTYAVKDLARPVYGRGKYAETLQFERDRGDAETLAHYFANAIRRCDSDKPQFWRTNGSTLRAHLSDRYLAIDNDWLLDTLATALPGARLSHWLGDSDTIWGNILLPDTIRQETDSEYGGMLSLSNSEIGTRRFGTLPSIFRAICMNGCIWGQSEGIKYGRVHRGKSLDLVELRAEMLENLNQQIPLVSAGIQRFLGLRQLITDVAAKPIFAELAIKNGFSRTQATATLQAYADEIQATPDYAGSLFAITNAITRAGQTLTPDQWVRFDEIGGALSEFDADDWRTLTNRAASLKATEVDAVFAA